MTHGWRALPLVLLLISFSANADITDVDVDGASRVSGDDSPKVYGGALGNCTDSEPCNTCTGGLTACNESEIGDNVELTITFKSTSDGVPKLMDGTDEIASGTSVSAGNTATIEVDWVDICNHFDDDAGAACNAIDGEEAYTIGISENDDTTLDDSTSITFSIFSRMAANDTVVVGGDDGIDGFTLFPGDEKFYLEDLDGLGAFPSFEDSNSFRKIHVFFDEGDCGDIANVQNDSDLVSTKFEDDGETPSEDFYTGFDNGTTYVGKIALEDEAGNIGLFTADGDCDDDAHVFTPDDVFGVLDEGVNCFIATASYESGNHKTVETLRLFRSKLLLPFTWGKWVTKMYYRYSPLAANVIRDNPTLRWVSRILIFPFYVYASIALEIGHTLTLISFFLLLFFTMHLFKKVLRRENSF